MVTVTHPTPLYGLVLIGGKSTRMKQDKSALKYHDKKQSVFCFDLLSSCCEKVFLSNRNDQAMSREEDRFPQIHDRDEFSGIGPLGGILSAMHEYPDAGWLVLACDLPYINKQALETLIKNRDPQKFATAYTSTHDTLTGTGTLPEPLCAIYEPAGKTRLLEFLHKGMNCPRKILINSDVKLLQQSDKATLDNINTPEEYQSAIESLRQSEQ